jgi:hypothetical protein
MSEISEKAIKLIKDLRRDISIDIMFTPEKNAEDDSLKALVDYIAELEGKFDQLTARWRQERQDDKWIPVSEPPKECEMRVFKDGNAWCFVLPDFQDLQVSPSVWMKKGVLDKIYKELRSVRDE